MIRRFLYETLLFLLPFALYAAYLRLAKRDESQGERKHPWTFLFASGLVLVAASFLICGYHRGFRPAGRVCAAPCRRRTRGAGPCRYGRAEVNEKLDPAHHAWMIEPRTRAVMDILTKDGGAARFVGGAVRNALLGEAVGDIDIATPLVPDEVMQRLQAARLGAVPTGIEHGTITAVSAASRSRSRR